MYLFLFGMKRWISYLFIVILTVFTLPVKQMGDALLKKNTTDQIDDTNTSASETAKQQQQMQEEVLHKYILPSSTTGFQLLSINYSLIKLQVADSRLVPHFVPEIPTPPPNNC